MAKPNTYLRTWLKSTDVEEARAVAKKASTSVPHLRHVAAGRRNMSAELAQRLAHAGGLRQQELCRACARCPLIK